MWDPDGVLHEDKCEESTKVNRDLSTWKCRTMHWGGMEETISEVNVILAEKKDRKKAQIIEDDTRIILTCQEKGTNCRAEKPDGGQLWVAEGLLMSRYTAFDTVLSST